MKEKLTTALGAVGFVIYYVISVLITFAPLAFLDFSFLIDFIIIAVITTAPFVGNIVNVVIWVWALIVCISGKQDAFSIIYYILFVLNSLNVVSKIISAFRK